MADHPDYRVRGPDPDGAWFIVEVVNGEELFLDETFDSDDAALAAIEKMGANDADTETPAV